MRRRMPYHRDMVNVDVKLQIEHWTKRKRKLKNKLRI